MLAENLLQKIGFTDEMIEKYNTYSPVMSTGCVSGDLPEDTRLQKEFKKYLKENTVFGGGRGAALFDGEKILTRRDDEC